MKKVMLLTLVMLVLTSCADEYASNGEKLYMQSHNGNVPTVPPPLTANNLSDFYDLPSQNQDARVSIEPPPAS